MIPRLRSLDLLGVLLVASLVGPVLVFVAIARLTYVAAFADAERELMWTSEVGREHASKVFDSLRLVADRIQDGLSGLDDAMIRRREEELHGRFRGQIAGLPQIQSFVVLSREARLLVATATFPVSTAEDFSDRDYFVALKTASAEPREAPSDFVSRVQVSRVSGKPFFGWGRARRGPDGAFAGVIDIAISPDFFMGVYETLLRKVSRGVDGRVVTMIRDDGQILLRYPGFGGRPVLVPSGNPFFEAIRVHPEGGTYENRSVVDTGAPQRLFAFSKVPGHPIYIVAGRSFSAITGEWRNHLLVYLGAGLPGTAALFLVTLAARRSAGRERKALAQARVEMGRREEAEAALLQAQKMEAIGQLTGGIAHDFNNVLQGVAGSLDLIHRKPEDPARIRVWAGAGLQAARRGAALTAQLLAFSRSQSLELKPISLGRLLPGLEDLLARTLGPAVRLRLDIPPGDRAVRGNETQLEMALLNLAINARDAMPGGGEVRITAHDLVVGDDPELAPGDYVRLTVLDTGSGMPPEVLRRALEPFFTTKGVGKGTGLGLSQVYGMMRQSGGSVRIESRPGAGTAVHLLLRRVEAAPATEIAEPARSAGPEPAAATVLVVDDDPDVRRFLMASLDALGFTAIEAGDGEAGLAALAGGEPDVMILDFLMPGRTGAEVARIVHRDRPGFPIVFASGFADIEAIRQSVGDRAPILRKPFSIDELKGVLTQVLGAGVPRNRNAGAESTPAGGAV